MPDGSVVVVNAGRSLLGYRGGNLTIMKELGPV